MYTGEMSEGWLAIWRVIGFLYGLMGTFSDAFWRSLWWLWNVTPGHWPVWAKLLIYPLTLALMYAPISFINARRNNPKVYGKATFAGFEEIKKAGMLEPGGRYLGEFWRKRFLLSSTAHDMFLHGEGHCLTIAAQGSGKTTGLVIPTLLNYTGGTVVVTDPKGAITAQTRRFRESVGRVVVLNPWRLELLNDPAFGVDLGDDGMNPLQGINATPEGRAAASQLAALLLPDIPGETQPYFRQDARDLLGWCLLWQSVVIKNPDDRTLPLLHGMIYDVDELVRLLELAGKDKSAAPGRRALRLVGAKFYAMAKAAPAQFTGVLGTLTTALSIYDEETHLGQHVSKPGGFRLADLKGEEKLTLYVICPPGHLVGDDRKWLNLVLASISQQIGRPGFARETVLLMDEFPALGYLPNLAPAMEQFREAGLRVHLIAQNPGQIVTTYGADGLTRFWGAAETKQFFRITDPGHAKLLSEWLGQKQVVTVTRNAKGELSESLVGVPLIRPEELTGMAHGRQVIMRPAMNPLWAWMTPYFERPAWAALVDPNPYRNAGKGKRPAPGAATPATPAATGQKTPKPAQGIGLALQKMAAKTDEETAVDRKQQAGMGL